MQKRSSRIISDTTFSVSSSDTSPPPSWRFDDNDDVDLPTYNPLSAAAKREQSRLRSAHNAIHLIPLLLLLCGLVLWIFSNPENAWGTLAFFKNTANKWLSNLWAHVVGPTCDVEHHRLPVAKSKS